MHLPSQNFFLSCVIDFNDQIQTDFHKLVSSEISMISSLFILCPGAEKSPKFDAGVVPPL